MLPETHPLIEAVTEPLADNAEQRLAAHSLLEENFNGHDPAITENLNRLERADQKKFPRLWRVCLHLCAGLAVLLLTFPSLQLRDHLRNLQTLASFGYDGEPKSAVPQNLTPAQQLLIGDPALPGLRQAELLHLSAPERPDFYTEYTGKYVSEFRKLPEDYLEISARIDPGNSFPFYNAAAREGWDSLEKLPSTKVKSPRSGGNKGLREIPDERVWKLNDEEAFHEALDLVAIAASLPRYDTYETSMAVARFPLFDQERMIPRLRTLGYFAGQTSQVISIRKTADLISAQAYFLSVAGDKEGFLKLYSDNEAFLTHLSKAPDGTLITELVYAANASSTASAFRYGAERLGLMELAEKMQLRVKAFIDDANARELRELPEEDSFVNKGSILTGLMAPSIARQVANPPPFDQEEFTPGRFAEYDFFSTALLPGVIVVLGLVAIGVFLVRSRLPRPVKIISKRLDLLLRPTDWAWLAGAVVVCIALPVIITRYTVLGGRDFNIRHNQMLFPTVHYVLIILLLLTLPPAVIRWRLGKRLGAFGIDHGFRFALVVFPVIGALALLVAHPVIEHFSLQTEIQAMRPLALLPALWAVSILIWFGSIFFGKRDQRLAKATAISVLPTALSFAIILLAAFIPVLRESAEKWIAKDNLTRVVPTGLNSYEAEIARQKRREINAILGSE